MDNKNYELEYCPVCGHKLTIIEDEENKDKVKVFCYVCEFDGGSFDNRDDAVEIWGKKER